MEERQERRIRDKEKIVMKTWTKEREKVNTVCDKKKREKQIVTDMGKEDAVTEFVKVYAIEEVDRVTKVGKVDAVSGKRKWEKLKITNIIRLKERSVAKFNLLNKP